MGAFDGYTVCNKWSADVNSTYQYFPTQSAFSFFKGFGIEELNQLLDDAESTNSKTIYIPREYANQGHIGLQTWYVRALVNHYFGENK